MTQISGRKLRGTPSEPIVNLGGEFSRLAEEEGTHKAQLARVHAELAVHKEALAHERQQHAASRETCLLYTSPSPRDATLSRMPSSA